MSGALLLGFAIVAMGRRTKDERLPSSGKGE